MSWNCVSSFAQHQERLTVFRVSGSVHPSCCGLVSWMSWNCVSSFAHHQERLTVFTVSGSVHPSCCRLVSWMSWNWVSSFNSSMTPAGRNLGEHYQILQIHSGVPDDGRKHRRKHVKLTKNSKSTYKVASCWLLSTHSRHQTAATWVNTTRYCKYSQVFLMMGENIARNM